MNLLFLVMGEPSARQGLPRKEDYYWFTVVDIGVAQIFLDFYWSVS